MIKSSKLGKAKYLTVLNTLLCTLLFTSSYNLSFGQQYLPRHYWTFEGSNPMKDSMNNYSLNPNFYSSTYSVRNGAVGNNLYLDGGGRAIVATDNCRLDSAFTFELLFKPSHDINATTNFLTRRDNAIIIRMGYSFLQFTTNIVSSSGATINDNWVIDLEGIGRGSYSYYVDGNYHHLVFKYNPKNGTKEIWVDGQLPTGFSKTTATGLFNLNGGSVSSNTIDINTNTSYYKINGELDEVALYNISLPANSIYKHYQNFQAGQHYSFALSTIPTPVPAPITGSVDINEYAPGHPNYTVNAIEQLREFPNARYKKGHTMIPNFNWMGIRYMSGELQPGVSTSQAVANSVEIQKELAKNFNYSILVSSNTCTYTQYNDVSKYSGAWVQLANQNPQWKTAAISFWAQINPQNAGYSSNIGYIENKNLPSNHYLRNSSGQFVNLSASVSTNKFWSPAAPIDSFIKDGLTQKLYMQNLTSALNRPLNYISENAEVIPKPSTTTMQGDPAIVADKNTTSYDWDTYLGNRKKRAALAYRDQFINGISSLADTKYAEYQICGLQARHKYSETRLINKPINGQVYATPDFYPRWPSNWLNGSSAWNGWKDIVEGRYYELQQNDNLYSPYIAAGWNEDEERNIRPAQWLGLLKALNMTGAEFFYSGFFNEASSYNPPNPPPANPAGYIWQSVVPSYAQAVASRYEDILRNGSLLPGDVPYSVSNSNPGFCFSSGDQRKLVVVRKHNTSSKYAITGSIQPNSNMMGNSELEGNASINLNGQEVQFKIRRQGSTYLYDNSNPSQPVFVQLDGWHESSHPFRWSKDFNLEAELFDNTSTSSVIKTQRPNGVANGDFREFTSYVGFTSTTGTLEYNFTTKNSPNYYLWVRARSKNGTAAGVSVALSGSNQKSIGCVTDTAWQWYSLDACSGQAIKYSALNNNQEYTLQITPSNVNIEIDKILLTINPSLNLNPSQAVCGGSTISVLSSGPTSFCQGGSVVLSAPTGTSYAWSSGQTTQSITVNQSGNYAVTVGSNGGCNGVSTPITVTVLNRPTATITAAGPTSICNGQNVVLNASSGASYLWSNGATTPSITTNAAGNYSVTITATNGCTANSAIQNVSVASSPSATISSSNGTAICQGKNTVLSAPTGLNYIWSNGSTNQSITVNTAGNYSVTVTNSNGCSAVSSPFTISVNANPISTVTTSGSTTFCSGGNVTLTSSPSTSCLWSNGQTSNSINVTQSGSYSVVVTSVNGCTSISNPVVVISNPLPIANVTVNGNTNLQSGQTTSLVASGGQNYVWTPGGSTNATLTVSTAGNYSVAVTDANGCSAVSSPVTITQSTQNAMAIQTSGNTSICPGQNLTLTATGGTNYLWAPGGQNTASITINQGGTYYVYARNSQGQIIAKDSIIIGTYPKPMDPWISITYVPNVSYQLKAFEPSAVSYLWSNAQTTSTITVANPQRISVTATNGFGCVSNATTMDVSSPNTRSCVSTNMLTAYDLSDTSAFLGWNPAITAEQMILSYWIAGTSNVTARTLSGTSSSTRVANLSPGSTYNWTVQTICASGNNTSVTGQFKTLGAPLSCGSTPQQLRAENINTTKAKLCWYNTIGDTYKLRFRPVGSSSYSYRNLIGSQYATGTQLNNLISNTTYEWQIQVTCSGYTTPYSQPSYFKTIDTCGYVGNLSVLNVAPNSAMLKWQNIAPMDTVRIRITETRSGQIRMIILNNNPANGCYTIRGLKSNTAYKVEVRGKCSSGAIGEWSNSITFITNVFSNRDEENGILQLVGYPIPTSDVLNYTFISDKQSDYLVKVCDLSGRIIYEEQKVADEGENSSSISVIDYAKGVYLFVVQRGTELNRFRFTVQ